ncbi:DNA segregation ATPase FtsK/SpoIIIE, S-DNA-T family [Oceanobacillus limi]|uniref:DNA segregation ATPase FtsK/SpoIIIE, S-DNA-T family n=1 Tax=Oceanobacillus limi TaxID=930131 RepID=A0A1I0HMF6_9BACI|nr:FtsK/SpoIIIE domain-containing protein [Oceanobacillus limi]SET84326.1 DNA segregation ATPase FtsK/SpoIIIE, S-DNA-T family [Oceanobacillus limi]
MSLIIGSGIAAFSMYAAARWSVSINEQKKIEEVFRNINYKVKDQEPRLFKKIKKDDYTDFIYNVPFGLVDDDKLQSILTKTLNKPIKVEFKGKLFIRVYNQQLQKIYKYKDFPATEGWTIPVGKTQEGMIYHDFDKVPHITIAGATRWGKTVFMKMLMTHLIENHPDDVEFYILDLKGGLAFHRYSKLKQVKGVASNYKESAEALKRVEKDIKRTMKEFKNKYYENIVDTDVTKRKFIIIDEAGELVPNKSMSEDDQSHAKTCQRIMSHVVRVSGGLGYRMIFGTQYPTAKIMDNQIKANSSAKITFKLETGVQSKVAIDQTGAEELQYPGRAIYKTTDKYIVQTPFISNEEMWKRLRRFERESDKKESTKAGEDIIKFG